MIQTRQQWQTNAPHPPAVSMATAVRRSNTDGIAQWGMSRATPKATECRHWAILTLYCPSSHQGNSKQNDNKKNVPNRLAILMAAVVRRYNTACIAQ
jgi:hypothetical protein